MGERKSGAPIDPADNLPLVRHRRKGSFPVCFIAGRAHAYSPSHERRIIVSGNPCSNARADCSQDGARTAVQSSPALVGGSMPVGGSVGFTGI